MYKKLHDFKKRFNRLKNVDPQTNENKIQKQKVLDNIRDLFNELYYIYKDKYSEEKGGLKTKNKLFYYKKLRLIDDYQYESEEKQQSSKKPDKKGEQSDELRLPKWIKVRKQRFDVIKKEVQNAKKIIYRLDQKGAKLLILTKQANYFMKQKMAKLLMKKH